MNRAEKRQLTESEIEKERFSNLRKMTKDQLITLSIVKRIELKKIEKKLTKFPNIIFRSKKLNEKYSDTLSELSNIDDIIFLTENSVINK